MPEILGTMGMIIVALAYVPQITALVRTNSAADISLLSWQLFFVANILSVTSAFASDSVMFKAFTITNLTLVSLTLVLIIWTRKGLGRRPLALLGAGRAPRMVRAVDVLRRVAGRVRRRRPPTAA